MADFQETDEYGNVTSVTGSEHVMEELTKLLKPSRKERSKIIEAGTPVATKHIRDATPYREHKYKYQNYLGGKLRNPQHIRDGVTHKPNQYMDGSTDIGYNSSSAPIARWVNNGTWNRIKPGTFFFDHAINTLNTDEVFGRENAQFEKMVKEKYPDLQIHFE